MNKMYKYKKGKSNYFNKESKIFSKIRKTLPKKIKLMQLLLDMIINYQISTISSKYPKGYSHI